MVAVEWWVEQGCNGRAGTNHRPTACLQSRPMKILNSIMIVIGWTVAICALLAALGLGSVHLHFGPFDFRLPAHFR
jgi:hypothetical protein